MMVFFIIFSLPRLVFLINTLKDVTNISPLVRVTVPGNLTVVRSSNLWTFKKKKKFLNDKSVCVQVEEGWWEGFLNGKTGMFPSNFTKEIVTESDTAATDSSTSQEDLRSGRTSESQLLLNCCSRHGHGVDLFI